MVVVIASVMVDSVDCSPVVVSSVISVVTESLVVGKGVVDVVIMTGVDVSVGSVLVVEVIGSVEFPVNSKSFDDVDVVGVVGVVGVVDVVDVVDDVGRVVPVDVVEG